MYCRPHDDKGVQRQPWSKAKTPLKTKTPSLWINSPQISPKKEDPKTNISEGQRPSICFFLQEGVPEMAKRMLPTIQDLAAAHQVCAPEIMEVHYESITGSSAGFDANVEMPG